MTNKAKIKKLYNDLIERQEVMNIDIFLVILAVFVLIFSISIYMGFKRDQLAEKTKQMELQLKMDMK